jgi:hypothetical protein
MLFSELSMELREKAFRISTFFFRCRTHRFNEAEFAAKYFDVQRQAELAIFQAF